MSVNFRDHIHTPNDGRGQNRVVLLNGREISRVAYADTRRGFVRVFRFPIRCDKYKKRALLKTMRGNVAVITRNVVNG